MAARKSATKRPATAAKKSAGAAAKAPARGAAKSAAKRGARGRNAAPVETFNQGDARCEATRGCADGAEVVFCTITGGGHTWPGGAPFPGGHISADLSATDAMWDFFVAHPRS